MRFIILLILTLSASAERKALDDIYDNCQSFVWAKTEVNKNHPLKTMELGAHVFNDKKQHLFTRLPIGWIKDYNIKYYQPRAKGKTLTTKIIEEGDVYILVNDNWETSKEYQQKFREEWKHISHVETTLFKATIYRKYFKAGETLTISNARYNPPILLEVARKAPARK